jgi:hypothetical protein
VDKIGAVEGELSAVECLFHVLEQQERVPTRIDIFWSQLEHSQSFGICRLRADVCGCGVICAAVEGGKMNAGEHTLRLSRHVTVVESKTCRTPIILTLNGRIGNCFPQIQLVCKKQLQALLLSFQFGVQMEFHIV